MHNGFSHSPHTQLRQTLAKNFLAYWGSVIATIAPSVMSTHTHVRHYMMVYDMFAMHVVAFTQTGCIHARKAKFCMYIYIYVH